MRLEQAQAGFNLGKYLTTKQFTRVYLHFLSASIGFMPGLAASISSIWMIFVMPSIIFWQSCTSEKPAHFPHFPANFSWPAFQFKKRYICVNCLWFTSSPKQKCLSTVCG